MTMNSKENQDELLLKAYNIGWNNCLCGDDIPELDALADDVILKKIKTEETVCIRSSEWERTSRNKSVTIPVLSQRKYQKAIRYAAEKHGEQRLPGSDITYMVHVANVAMEIMFAYFHNPNFDLDFALQTALLHDVLEDTNTSEDELKTEFGEKITTAVKALSKNKLIADKNDRMQDSLERILSEAEEVGMVKLADRITNLQRPPGNWSADKIDRYKQEAQSIYQAIGHCNTYLSDRLKEQIIVYSNY